MSVVRLEDRAVIRISGDDAETFLQGLLTADMAARAPGDASLAALLTPQGKILFDMLLHRDASGFWLDCHVEMAEALAKRLSFYRLRAKVEITPADEMNVLWCSDANEAASELSVDPRNADLGLRGIGPCEACEDGSETYHAQRIAAGIAEMGADFEPESVFPHEANFDLLAGVSFSKGCYVGQEVVSRMHHRGTARKRCLPCTVDGDLPEKGTSITAGERTVGTVGSSANGHAMALLRLDHVEQALDGTIPLLAGGSRLAPRVPEWLATVVGDLAKERA